MRRKMRAVAVVAASLVGAFILVNLMGGLTYRLGAFELFLRVRFEAPGGTSLVIAPIGRVYAATHPVPLGISLEVENIDLALLQPMVTDTPDTKGLVDIFRRGTQEAAKRFALKVLALGALGGALGAWAVGSRGLREAALGAVLGLMFVGAATGITYATYDVSAFSNPSYSGILEAAPWMISVLGDGIHKVGELGDRLKVIAGNIYALFERIDSVGSDMADTSDLSILHVSDIHNNPAAFDFIEELVRSFDVDAVVDTGDITDYGTSLEAQLVDRIERLGVPYFFVPGNHDSPDVVDRMRSLENVVVLDGNRVNFRGLVIAGKADPGSMSPEMSVMTPAQVAEAAEEIGSTVTAAGAVDILAVHNNMLAQRFVGVVPVVLHGHDHRMKVTQDRGTVLVDAGTTGAAGLRLLEKPGGVPFTVALLHFSKPDPEGDVAGGADGVGESRPPEPGRSSVPGHSGGANGSAREAAGVYRLVAVDTIEVKSLESGFVVARTPVEYEEPQGVGPEVGGDSGHEK